MNYKYVSNHGLKVYTSISDEELLYLLNSKSLFGRKFNIGCVFNTHIIWNSFKLNFKSVDYLEGTKSTFLKCNIYKLNCNKNKK